jgi:hypothetical protein
MVIHYWCSACSRVLFVSKGLDECAQECPSPDEAAEEDAPPQVAADDARFLESMGIVSSD